MTAVSIAGDMDTLLSDGHEVITFPTSEEEHSMDSCPKPVSVVQIR